MTSIRPASAADFAAISAIDHYAHSTLMACVCIENAMWKNRIAPGAGADCSQSAGFCRQYADCR